MVLNCHAVGKSFDGETILRGVSFHIEDNEKAALIGINGAGKTTLLRMIVGDLEPDAGEITFTRGKHYGYLAQNQDIFSDRTVYDELKEAKRDIINLEKRIAEAEEQMKTLTGDELNKLMDEYTEMQQRFRMEGGYAWRSGVTGVARGLGFSDDDLGKPIKTLSGGQRTRVALGRLLLKQPDFILLDEPTNHLDIGSIRWLETYLRTYRGAVLVVSHDRYFLDRIVTKVIEIDHTRGTVFQGNYSAYAAKKERLRAEQWHAYVNQQQEIKHQEEVIRKLKSYNREKSVKRAESREKMLDRIERIEKPTEVKSEMRITLTPHVTSGNDVLSVTNLMKSFGGELLFRDVNFEIKRGERVAIIGDNGTGKTTMLKIINGLLPPDRGSVRFGVKVYTAYYDQEMQLLHNEKTLFDEISDAYPQLDNTTIRSTLAAFLFTGDDVFKRIGSLSGGEKGKLALAKLMLSDANFILLDEPTNHLDMVSREVLESALTGYEGTVLFVSHDRYFINRVATRILDLTNGMLINYIGNYDYYMEHRPERMQRLALTAPYKEKEKPAPHKPPSAGVQTAVNAQPPAKPQQRIAKDGSAYTGEIALNNAVSAIGAADIRDHLDENGNLVLPDTDERTEGAREAVLPPDVDALSALADAIAEGVVGTGKTTSGAEDWKAQKELAAMKRKRETALKKCEEMIDALETRNREIDDQMGLADVATNAQKLKWLADEQSEINERLSTLYEEWESLS